MIRCLHTADLHLGASFPALGTFGAVREQDFVHTFRRVIDLAIHREVDLFLIAGDLFDNPSPERALIGCVEGELQRLVQRGILPVLLPGTHDYLLAGESVYHPERFKGALQLVRNDGPVRITVRDDVVFLYSCCWDSGRADDLRACMARRPGDGIHLGLLHGSLEGSPDWQYRGKDLPFTFPALKQWGLDYVALGHYHRFQQLEDGNRLRACYPGSPEGKRFGENGPRHALIVDLEPGRAVMEPVEVQSRQLLELELEVDGQMTDTDIAEAIAAMGGEGTIVRLCLRGVLDRALDRDYLAAYAESRFDYLELVDETRWLQGDFIAAIAEEETVRGACVRRFRSLLAAADNDVSRHEIEQAFREVMVRFQGGAR
ncbi:metallophosphoesterase family protein [Geothermobacter hydrogeniphilus]|nr:DNA repair exonuclease [Geothermobacter hydrogeniphilus]